MPDRDDSTGRFVDSATLDDVRRVFGGVPGPPVVTSADVAESTGLSRQSARRKLETLQDRGEVASRKTAGRVLWWLLDDVEDSQTPQVDRRESDRDSRATAPERASGGVETPREAVETGDDSRERGSTSRPASGPAASDARELADVDFPEGVDHDQACAAVLAAQEYIREQGGATKKEIVRAVMPEYPLAYDVDGALAKIEAGDRYRGAWWRRVVSPGLEALRNVEKPTGGRSEWRYTGGD